MMTHAPPRHDTSARYARGDGGTATDRKDARTTSRVVTVVVLVVVVLLPFIVCGLGWFL
jgi:hypothetical protein